MAFNFCKKCGVEFPGPNGAAHQCLTCKRCERAGVENIPADQARNGEPICSDCVTDLNETDWDDA